MFREIVSHKINECNDGIKIAAVDLPSEPGKANHHYRLEWSNPKWGPDPSSMRNVLEIAFQNGPIPEVGTNGVTHEALLAIVIDRLKGFQSGPFACRENALALTRIEEAMHWLHHRTRERAARGVEGTYTK